MSGEEVVILQSIRQKPPFNDNREKNIGGACVPDGIVELPYFLLPGGEKSSVIKPLYLSFYCMQLNTILTVCKNT